MSQAFTIHQFHYSASHGDAVTNHMLVIQKSLLDGGVGGSILAVERKHLQDEHVLQFKKERIWDCDLLLVHHSHGNPALANLLEIEIPKILIYHNITPAHFFPHDPAIQQLCKMGRSQLLDLKDAVLAAFADSRYNARELGELGYKNVGILPLLDLESLDTPRHSPSGAPSRCPSSSINAGGENSPKNLLFVGRLSPHKNQRLLIETLFYLKQKLPKYSKLVLVGSGDPVYTRYLKLLAKQLGLSHSVQFTGRVTDKELSHLYEAADAFVCTSLHEGFCIPLVEAMRHGLPVFYLPEGAIPETMGSAGVRLEMNSPLAIAEVLFHALGNAEIIGSVLESQKCRLEELSKVQTADRIRQLLLPFLPELETRYLPKSHPVEVHAN